MSSHAGHVTTETVFRQTLTPRLRNGDEHRALESDTTGLNVKGNLYLYLDSNVSEKDLEVSVVHTLNMRQQ